MQRTRYDAVAMALHWIMAILMVIMIFFGEDLMDEDGGTFLPSIHVSIGTAILALTVVRLAWRLMNPPPALPATMAPWEQTLSKLTHVLFYLLMIGLPITGWLAFGDFVREEPGMAGVRMFGLFAVPGAPVMGEFVKEIHEVGSKVAMVLVILHVLAALKHQFVNRDDILRRMLPH